MPAKTGSLTHPKMPATSSSGIGASLLPAGIPSTAQQKISAQ